MLKLIEITNGKGKKFTISFVNIDEAFTAAVEKYQHLWQDETIMPLYNLLFEMKKDIFAANSSTDINAEITKEELKGNELSNDGIKYIFDKLNEKNHTVIAQQGRNFIGISSYHLNNLNNLNNKMANEEFFQTISHELVHCIDQFAFGDFGLFSVLKGNILSSFNESAEKILGVVKATQDSSDTSFGDVNTDDALKNDHEKLPYCIQAYVTALMSESGSAGLIKNDIKNLIKITTDLAGGIK